MLRRFVLLTTLFALVASGGDAFAATLNLSVSNQRNNSQTSSTYTLSWTPTSDGIGNYKFLYEWNPSGQRNTLYNGNAATPVTLTRNSAGRWRYQVVFARKQGKNFITTSQSNVLDVYVPVPVKPNLINLARSPLENRSFEVQWTNDPGDFIYELHEDTNPNFATPNFPQYWPTANREPIPGKPAATYYYRVRSWTALPQNGGRSSAWSNTITVPVLSNEGFLDDLANRIVDYFQASTYPNGLTLDRYGVESNTSTVVSTAATGFYLASLPVAVERGKLSLAEASAKAQTSLGTLLNTAAHERGFFYHFLQPNGSASTIPALEVSSIDTALLVAGALTAGEYFGGDVKAAADSLYRRVEWSWMYDPQAGMMRMAWHPSNGFFGHYNSYSEAILLYLLAIGAPAHAIPADSFYTFARPKGNYAGPDFIFTPGGELFTYQYPHAFFDFRTTADALGVNWWQNSVEAARANQRYAIDQSALGYSADHWGLTPCDGPDGYKAYGAKPSYYNQADGTVAPTGIAGSIKLAEDIALPALKNIYANLGSSVWKQYGFVDSFNVPRSWVDDYYLGIDQGIMLLMLENRKSGLIWQRFMANEHARRGLERAGFTGYGTLPGTRLDDFEDRAFWSPDSTLGWWDIDGTLVYRRTEVKDPSRSGWVGMKVDYNKANMAWSYFAGHLSPANPKKDFTGSTKLVVWVYGQVELLVKIRDRSNAEAELGWAASVNPNAWNKLVFNLTGAAVNLADVDNILFFAAPGNPSASGTFTIDDVTLE